MFLFILYHYCTFADFSNLFFFLLVERLRQCGIKVGLLFFYGLLLVCKEIIFVSFSFSCLLLPYRFALKWSCVWNYETWLLMPHIVIVITLNYSCMSWMSWMSWWQVYAPWSQTSGFLMLCLCDHHLHGYHVCASVTLCNYSIHSIQTKQNKILVWQNITMAHYVAWKFSHSSFQNIESIRSHVIASLWPFNLLCRQHKLWTQPVCG